MKYPIDRNKLNEYFQKKNGHAVTAYGIACAVGVERIYGGTMAKWVRDGVLEKCPANGYYRVIGTVRQ